MRVRLAAALLAVVAALTALPAAGGEGLAWELLEVKSPWVLWTGSKAEFTLRIRNVGTTTWSAASNDNVSYHFWTLSGDKVIFDGVRTRVPRVVNPGEEVEVVAVCAAPAINGRYVLEWDMVRERVRWFGPPASGAPARSTVVVLHAARTWLLGLLVVTVGLVALARSLRPADGSRWWAVVGMVPVVWLWGVLAVLGVVFPALSAVLLWRGGLALSLSAAALPAMLLLLLPGRWRSVGAGVAAASAGLLAAADLIHLRGLAGVLSFAEVHAIGQVHHILDSVRSLYEPDDGWLLAFVAAGAVMAAGWPRWPSAHRPPRLARLAGVGVVALAGVIVAAPAIRLLQGAFTDATRQQLFSQPMLLGQWGLVNLHLFDTARLIGDRWRRSSLSAEERERVRRHFQSRPAPAASPAFGAAAGANVVLVQLESVQQWVLDAHIDGQPVMPFLSSLRASALHFPWTFDQSSHGRTSDAEFATLNSQFPLPSGAVAFRRAGNHFHALPQVLAAHGYETLSAHAFDRAFWNRAVLHPRYGFKRSVFPPDLPRGEQIGWGLADTEFLRHMATRVAALPEPYFAFLITLGLHHPFDGFPVHHRRLKLGELEETPLGNYLHNMHFLDRGLRDMMRELHASGALSRTVVALYGDHHAALGFGRSMLRVYGQPEHSAWLKLYVHRVPLIVVLPGAWPDGAGSLTGAVEVPGGHVDIAPSLLYLLGIPSPPGFVGSPLLPGREDVVGFVDGSAVGRGLGFLAGGPEVSGAGACFALADGTPLPRAACEGIAEHAWESVSASRAVVEHNLLREVESPLSALSRP